MDTVFIVKNGGTDETSIRPPPDYLPACSKNSLFGADQSMLQMEEWYQSLYEDLKDIICCFFYALQLWASTSVLIQDSTTI